MKLPLDFVSELRHTNIDNGFLPIFLAITIISLIVICGIYIWKVLI